MKEHSNTLTSLIGWLNILIVQWFFMRIYWSVSLREQNKGKVLGYGILFPVVPLTGWVVSYIPWSMFVPRHPLHLQFYNCKD